MIIFTALTNSFLKDITVKNLLGNENFRNFIRKITSDKEVYFIGDKKYFTNILKKFEKYLKQNNSYRNNEILYNIHNKSEWVNQNIENKIFENIPCDCILISESEIKSKSKLNLISYKNVKKNLIKIEDKIDELKNKVFEINIKKINKYKNLSYNNFELDKVKYKLTKNMEVSDKILIWDPYIPQKLVFYNKDKRKLFKGTYHNDYCSTVNYLDKEIFAKIKTDKLCEILTMNKLQQDRHYTLYEEQYKKIVKKYINYFSKTKANIKILNFKQSIWTKQHERLIIFKNENDEIICYYIFSPGIDFIKLQQGEKYPATSDEWVYTFIPGNKTNIKTVISKIKELKESACIDIPNDLLNSENKIDNSDRDSSADNMIL